MAAYFSKQSPQELRRWRRNMWLGFSAERQKEFDERWRDMRPLADAGFLIFVSVAPMLEPVVLPDTFLALKERAWCVVAGEQGPAALCRDMDPAWARAIRDQCAAHGVAFFMKQLAKRQPIPPDLRVSAVPRDVEDFKMDLQHSRNVRFRQELGGAAMVSELSQRAALWPVRKA